jgi:hypothetical protein
MRSLYQPYSDRSPKISRTLEEAKLGLFQTFEKYFQPEQINSVESDFEFDSWNIFTIFDVLNEYFFGNELERINFCICSIQELRDILVQLGKQDDAKYDFYAMYLPQYQTEENKIVKHTIFVVDSYGKMAFKFAVSCMMHEMIHYYDFTKGTMKRIIDAGTYQRGDEHYTPEFKRYSRFAAKEGLKVMPNGYGKDFEELNKDVASFKQLTEEEKKAGWNKMVARLKAGEDIPGVALAPNGNVVFIIS